MIEGFWVIEVKGPQGSTGGVAVFVNGKVFGGDSGFSYQGNYLESGTIVQSRILVQNFDKAVTSILGVSGDYEMNISVNVTGHQATGTAMIASHPQHSVGIRMIKKANL